VSGQYLTFGNIPKVENYPVYGTILSMRKRAAPAGNAAALNNYAAGRSITTTSERDCARSSIASVPSAERSKSCPKFSPPVSGGFVVMGPAYITGYGGPAPFGNSSMLTLCMLGAGNVKFSNITIALGAPANTAIASFMSEYS
jgi:hypothetical protein